MSTPTKKKKTAMALHAASGDMHLVGIGNLRVVIVPDGEFWFAQALEIDYAVQGDSEAGVKTNFENGLEATIEQHLKIYGHLKKFLKPAPPDVWKEFVNDPSAKGNYYYQVSTHDLQEKLPYPGITYLIARANQARETHA